MTYNCLHSMQDHAIVKGVLICTGCNPPASNDNKPYGGYVSPEDLVVLFALSHNPLRNPRDDTQDSLRRLSLKGLADYVHGYWLITECGRGVIERRAGDLTARAS
jgi:hypothetical protein